MLKGIHLSPLHPPPPKIICMQQNCGDVLPVSGNNDAVLERKKTTTKCRFTGLFKSPQIRIPWDKHACQSYLSRFQFSFPSLSLLISGSTCAARAPYWLRGERGLLTRADAFVQSKGKTLTGMVMKPRYEVGGAVGGTAGSTFQTCVRALIGASVVCCRGWEGWDESVGLPRWRRQTLSYVRRRADRQ